MRTRLGRASRDRQSTPRGSCGRRGRCRALPQPCPGDAHEEVLAGKKGGAGAGVIHAAAAGLAGGAGGRDGETPLSLALWPAAPGVPQGRSPACGRERGLRGWRRQQAGLRSVAGRVTRGPAAQSHPAASRPATSAPPASVTGTPSGLPPAAPRAWSSSPASVRGSSVPERVLLDETVLLPQSSSCRLCVNPESSPCNFSVGPLFTTLYSGPALMGFCVDLTHSFRPRPCSEFLSPHSHPSASPSLTRLPLSPSLPPLSLLLDFPFRVQFIEAKPVIVNGKSPCVT